MDGLGHGNHVGTDLTGTYQNRKQLDGRQCGWSITDQPFAREIARMGVRGR